jgi:class 3 adenylate cyclase
MRWRRRPIADLLTGTVTFLLTDIEGSTRLRGQHPEVMQEAPARHNALLAEGIRQHEGSVVKGGGRGPFWWVGPDAIPLRGNYWRRRC